MIQVLVEELILVIGSCTGLSLHLLYMLNSVPLKQFGEHLFVYYLRSLTLSAYSNDHLPHPSKCS